MGMNPAGNSPLPPGSRTSRFPDGIQAPSYREMRKQAAVRCGVSQSRSQGGRSQKKLDIGSTIEVDIGKDKLLTRTLIVLAERRRGLV